MYDLREFFFLARQRACATLGGFASCRLACFGGGSVGVPRGTTATFVARLGEPGRVGAGFRTQAHNSKFIENRNTGGTLRSGPSEHKSHI